MTRALRFIDPAASFRRRAGPLAAALVQWTAAPHLPAFACSIRLVR